MKMRNLNKRTLAKMPVFIEALEAVYGRKTLTRKQILAVWNKNSTAYPHYNVIIQNARYKVSHNEYDVFGLCNVLDFKIQKSNEVHHTVALGHAVHDASYIPTRKELDAAMDNVERDNNGGLTDDEKNDAEKFLKALFGE